MVTTQKLHGMVLYEEEQRKCIRIETTKGGKSVVAVQE